LVHHRFYKAVKNIEQLVVMQLLELTELKMSGLGYKLRTQNSKALKTCTAAIKNAIEHYNKYAAEFDPLKALLIWD
ncbi:hypothetical protein SERLA73DRAFT_47541, partial [Serpula lacrymans var. lacrymans S7.3]